jgi:protein phosphatase
MGSRAVVVLCKDTRVPQARFGVREEHSLGVILTRTGRPFFADVALEQALLMRVRDAAERAGLWQELATDWMCLDCELMPWSAKAQALIREQYAAVGKAASTSLRASVAALQQAAQRVPEAAQLLHTTSERAVLIDRYIEAYRRYCWPVVSVQDYRLAPFHLLASEGRVHTDRDHAWHMHTLAKLASVEEPVLVATPWRLVDLSSQHSEDDATAWWTTLTENGGEGMVVKPLEFIARGPRGLLQPAMKVRGPEYLRIIYGPEYSRPEHISRLRARGLAGKRSLALREFSLGVESLDRFVRREPLRRVHECVFAVLAMESEPVDPRL